MSRRTRIIVPDTPLHIIQQGHNHQSSFFAEEDYLLYFDWLKEDSKITGCLIHAYVLPTTRISHESYRLTFGEHFVRKQLIALFFNCIVITTLSSLLITPTKSDSSVMVEHHGDCRWLIYRGNDQGNTSYLIRRHPSSMPFSVFLFSVSLVTKSKFLSL